MASRAGERRALTGADDARVEALRRPSYGTNPGTHDIEAGSSSSVHTRQGSLGPYSRKRLLTAREPGPAHHEGDFIIHDLLNEKTRSYVLDAEERRRNRGARGTCDLITKVYFVLTLTGIGAGVIAAGLDLVVEWLAGIKFGYCRRSWFLTRDVCCDIDLDDQNCTAFRSWSDAFSSLPLLGTIVNLLPTSFTQAAAFFTVALLFAVISAFLVKRFSPYAAGSGVPEIKTVLSGVVIKGYLSPEAVVIKSVGLAFSVAAGLNLGKEGPFVHLASAIAHICASAFKEFRDNHATLMGFVTVGTAAGVSVAFDAPVGGVLFAFEEAASYFPNTILWRSFFASTLAALVLKLSNPFLNGRAVMFQVDHSLDWYWFEMIAFFVIGALGGILGAIFIRWNVRWSKFRLHNEFIKKSPIFEIACIVSLTTILSYPFVYLRQSNNQILTELFSECQELADEGGGDLLCNPSKFKWMIVVLSFGCISKLFLTVLTFGARVPAGLFIPSMTIGACAGRIIGECMKALVEAKPDWALFNECSSSSVCVRPSIYGIVGAAATLGGVTQVSVSLVVIMFELTGGLSHLLPTMVGILAAKLVCALVHEEGIYDQHINLRRYPFLETKMHVSHEAVARTIMRKNLVVIPEIGFTIGKLQELIENYNFYGFPIVKSANDMILTGNIIQKELKHAIEKALERPDVGPDTPVSFKGTYELGDMERIQLASPSQSHVLNFGRYRDRYLLQVKPETPMSDVYDCFCALGVRMSFVTQEGKLLGLISKKDLIAFMDKEEGIGSKYFL